MRVLLAVLALLALSGAAAAMRLPLPIIAKGEGAPVFSNYQFEDICAAASSRPSASCLDASANGGRGCGNEQCCEQICSYDRGQCCTATWDDECTKLALWKPECTDENTFCEEEAHEIGLSAEGTFYEYTSNFHGATFQDFRFCRLVGASVWYKFESPLKHELKVDVCNSTFDNVLVAYNSSGSGPCPRGEQDAIACIDDCDGECNFGSIFEFVSEPGQTYWFQVGGFDAARGMFGLTVQDQAGKDGRAFFDPNTDRILRWALDGSGSTQQLTRLDLDHDCTEADPSGNDAHRKVGDVRFGQCTTGAGDASFDALYHWDGTEYVAVNTLVLDSSEPPLVPGKCVCNELFYEQSNSVLYYCQDGTGFVPVTNINLL